MKHGLLVVELRHTRVTSVFATPTLSPTIASNQSSSRVQHTTIKQ